MNRLIRYVLPISLLLLVALSTHAQQLIHYWNFNNNASEVALLTPTSSLVNSPSITHVPGGTSIIDPAGGTGQNFNVANVNARNNDPSGTHLRFNNPIGGQLNFALPTIGYQNIVVKFGTRRSGSGAGLQYWSYTTNGTTYIPFDTVVVMDGDPVLTTLDFSSITDVNNNPDFKIQVAFAAGAGGTVGNNRFDNFTAEGTPNGGPDVTPPVVTVLPIDQSTNISVNTQPTIAFNEPVRLISNAPLNTANAATVVTLRLNDVNGTLVPFTATYTNQTITIIPNATLLNNQQYYVALLPNVVEDFSDNAVATTQSAQFSTIALQTQFNAGDIVPVAYRMNATATDDEIALLTLVDVLPGTILNITDAKYTTNAIAQCAGGIVWTAPLSSCIPAGTVITIKTEALLTNFGTISGSGFGLSSGGDQVIVYTGTANNPQYVTALSSNAWVSTNTACNGSNSMLPTGLTDGLSSVNTSTAPGNVGGNAVNAYYNGVQTGTPAQLKANILDAANWVAVGGSTAPQQWPAFNFPSAPAVTVAWVSGANTISLVFNGNITPASATDLSNYTGIAGLTSATHIVGSTNDTVLLSFNSSFAQAATYTLMVSGLTNVTLEQMSCPYNFTFTYNTTVSFLSNFIVVNEDAGTLDLVLETNNPSAATVDLVLLPAPFSTANASDFTFSTQTISLNANSSITIVPIAIIDDNAMEQHAEYFALSLSNPIGCTIVGDTLATVYIVDNDRKAPQATKDIELNYVGSFDPSGANTSTCEIVVYDAATKRLFTTSAVAGFFDIIDFSNPLALQVIKSVDVNAYGGITSIAVHNGVLAVASPNFNEELDGSVLFFDIDGNFLKQVTVGALPDMITFSNDGKLVLTANEGQPTIDYTIDPEGSVSIIDISSGVSSLTQANVTTLYFTDYNAQEAALIASGIRKTKASSTLSQDLEPEYVAVSKDNTKAWVTLQENNAMAEIDLTTKTITDIWALGTKDINATGNGYDVSDNNNQILIANWPLKSYYIPDAVSTYNVAGKNYLITANEGDEKEYNGLVERTTVGANDYLLDPIAFPHAALLKKSYNLGRMRVTNLNGDTDGDGDFDEIYTVGSRSFSIWDTDTKTLVYDSGDDMEMITAADTTFKSLFNADHEANGLKTRSRAKGPEPEGLTMATLSNKQYAFIGLERIGGVMVYDVTQPQQPFFVDYKNTRSTSAYAGDYGPEGMVFIPANETTTNKNYLVVANEISGTLTVFEVKDNNLSTGKQSLQSKTFNVFPNPANGLVYFNRAADVTVYDMMGKPVYQQNNALTLNVATFAAGTYIVKTSDGAAVKLVIGQ